MYVQQKSIAMCTLLSVLAGCVHSADSLRRMSIEQVEARIEQEASKIHTIKGQAQLKVDAPEQKGVLELLVAVRTPDAIHLEVLDGLGRPVRIFVSQAGKFALWDTEENTFYRGAATRENLARFLPLYFAPEELAQVLLGKAPRLVGAKLALAGEEGGREALYVLKAEEATQRLSIEPKHFRITRSEVEGAQGYELTFGEFIRTGAQGVFPERRTLRVPSAQLFLELSYTDYSTNTALEDKLFLLVPQAGVRVVDLEEGLGLNGAEG